MAEQNDLLHFALLQDKEQPFRYDEGLTVFYALCGRAAIDTVRAAYPLASQGFFIVGPFEPHRARCPKGACLLAVSLSARLLALAGWPRRARLCCHAPGPDGEAAHDQVRALLAEMFQEFFQKKSFSTAHVTGHAFSLLRLLFSSFTLPQPAPEPPPREDLSLLCRALDGIYRDWNENLTLTALADRLFLSPSKLSRFLQQHLGMGFSEYLAAVRLGHARAALARTGCSVTQIALDSGFQSAHSFIRLFKARYHVTPGQYRREQTAISPAGFAAAQTTFDSGLATLLQYAQSPASEPPISRCACAAALDCSAVGQPLAHTWKTMINLGFARDILLAPVQTAVHRAQRDIGFAYARFVGLFDADMQIYTEDENQNAVFHFALADRVLDYLLSEGLRPWIELGGLPPLLAKSRRHIYNSAMIISPCADLARWRALVTATLRHCIARYGLAKVLDWKFTVLNMNYVFFGCMTHEEYRSFYLATYEAVKAAEPRLCFGGPGIFSNMLDEPQGMPAFLRLAKARGCMPDFFTLECYPYHNILRDEEFLDFAISQLSAPTVLSRDEDFLAHALDAFAAMLLRFGVDDRPVYLEEWNSTLWQRDLAGDTCYKAAYLIKNICENYDKVGAFGYWSLSDLLRERPLPEAAFHGGFGLFTANGIPKSGYQALCLTARLGGRKLGAGRGWFAAGSEEGVQLLLYNYSHYANLYRYRYQQLKKPGDAYAVFENKSIVEFQLFLSGLASGPYRMERYRIDRQGGSSFDRWIEMGAPSVLSDEDVCWLDDLSQPALTVRQVTCEGSLTVEAVLEPQQTELILLRRTADP